MAKIDMASMTYLERVAFYAAAKRATVGTICQFIDGDFKKFFVGKLRGKIVSRIGDGQYKFGTSAEAMACAIGFRDHSRKLLDEDLAAAMKSAI